MCAAGSRPPSHRRRRRGGVVASADVHGRPRDCYAGIAGSRTSRARNEGKDRARRDDGVIAARVRDSEAGVAGVSENRASLELWKRMGFREVDDEHHGRLNGQWRDVDVEKWIGVS
jgi:hypothetical protein